MRSKKYEVAYQRFDRHVVIPDLHGESRLLEQVIDNYPDDIGVVFLGDLIDKQGNYSEEDNVYNLMNIVKDLGKRAIVTLANHEYYLLGSLETENIELRRDYIDYYQEIKGSTFLDYDIFLENKYHATELLRDAMKRLGHLALLNNITPYYETSKFIATHAGIDHRKPWLEQKNSLDILASRMSSGNYLDLNREEEPGCVFSQLNAVDTRPITSTNKIIISGHAHYLSQKNIQARTNNISTSSKRVILNGQRIRLASQLNRPSNQDLYVWHDWDDTLERYSTLR